MEPQSNSTNHNGKGSLFPILPMAPAAPPLFPGLPIISVDPPRLSQREKYGSLFYVGLLGLVIAIGLVAWFAQGAWAMRDVWTNVYVLHDEARSEPDRVRAAVSLSRDPRVNQRQRWDICLRKPLPALARYVLAESLSAEASTADPRGYAFSVARSPGWPAWLRLLLTRPMAYAAAEGTKFPCDALEELRSNEDRAVSLWASAIVALEDPKDQAGVAALEETCRGTGWERDLGCILLESARAQGRPDEQKRHLDRATAWLRGHHPDCKLLWAPPADPLGPIPPKNPAPELHGMRAEPSGRLARILSPLVSCVR